jgi:hypothetical protein
MGTWYPGDGELSVGQVEEFLAAAPAQAAPKCKDCGRSDCEQGINAQGVCFDCVYGGTTKVQAAAVPDTRYILAKARLHAMCNAADNRPGVRNACVYTFQIKDLLCQIDKYALRANTKKE